MASIFLTLTAMYLWHLAADVDWEVSNRVWVYHDDSWNKCNDGGLPHVRHPI